VLLLEMVATYVAFLMLRSGYQHANPHVTYVSSFDDLLAVEFDEVVTAACWERTLDADFEAVVKALGERARSRELEEATLVDLALSVGGKRAVEHVVSDLRRLTELGLEPELNLIREYSRDATAAVVATDVYSFHVDRAPMGVDTWLCTYWGSPSQGLWNHHAVRRVDVPETRAELLRQYGGVEGPSFEAFLRDDHYDLHYVETPNAETWSFGVGHLWRVATAWTERPSRVACIHRAPADVLGQPRLLLIS